MNEEAEMGISHSGENGAGSSLKNLTIHIGAHKTGTTLVQSCFDKNSHVLEEHGIIYPRSNWYHHSQHRLAFSMKGMIDPSTGLACDFDREIEDLNRQIAAAPDGSDIFISSEEFFSAPLASISRLREKVKCDVVKIMAFVRSPDDLFLSLYNQNTKDPGNSFFKPIPVVIEDPMSIHRDMHMGKCVSSWASVFGYDNLSLYCYEDGSPLEAVLDYFHLPAGTIAAAARVNESVPAAVAEIMRLSKAFSMPRELRGELYSVASQKFKGTPRNSLSVDERRKILQLARQELDVLFSKFGRENPYREECIPDVEGQGHAVRPVKILIELIEELLVKNTHQ